MIKIGIGGIALTMLSACGNGTPDYDATGTFEATEVIVSAEAAGKLLNLDIEEGNRPGGYASVVLEKTTTGG